MSDVRDTLLRACGWTPDYKTPAFPNCWIRDDMPHNFFDADEDVTLDWLLLDPTGPWKGKLEPDGWFLTIDQDLEKRFWRVFLEPPSLTDERPEEVYAFSVSLIEAIEACFAEALG